MEGFKLLVALLYALPEILKFIRNAQPKEDNQKLNEKVRQDFERINKAFESKDPNELNDIFKS